MAVLRSLVRVAGVVSVSAALACTGFTAASAAPPGPSAAAAASAVTSAWQGAIAQTDVVGAYQQAIQGLQRFGMNPFLYPSASAFCADGSSLGLVPAIAGAVPGPWPKTTVSVPGVDLSAVKAGHTMFAFVPYGMGPDGADTSGMQVAWFNASTGQSGMSPMGSVPDVAASMVPPQVLPAMRPLAQQAIENFLGTALPMGGVRAVPVDTGSGTVLAAVFGTVHNGNHTCLFLPTVGVTRVA
ncbi:hypothetical protein [Nocardia macrotermitis]|uniref:Uncharacterized protein n=1 Tax=Nocardia macrotermitis TaxID=2585198 RepID=A0A7K0D6B9_9NOCA|nr:hypothetical protein [Nocardia macrotermitis]MQY21306.1 hypothetical protein [Nocardia macrotermitis]